MPGPPVASLEYVNLHTMPCGCRWLIAWEESRVKDWPRSAVHGRSVWADTIAWENVARIQEAVGETLTEESLLALMETEGALDNVPLRERQRRIVTRAEAESVVRTKRAHPDWKPHTVEEGRQPAVGLCPAHAALPYTEETYAQLCAEHAARVPPE